MSARPHFLRGFTPADFESTSGHTQPAVAAPQAVPLVTSEGGARLDTHRVFPAQDWLSDSDLGRLDEGQMPRWAGQTMAERHRRAETRKRLRQVREDMRITRRDWLLWILVAVAAIVASALMPEHWAGYGWHL